MNTRILSSKSTLLMVLFLATGLLVAACSPSAEKLNQDGNEAFTKQAFEDALSAYQSAQIESPELAEPYYNAANALYRQGAYPEALEQLGMALSFADQDTLAEKGLYNLGNTSFSSQDFESAIAAYTEALLIDPEDQEAKYNLELALKQQEQEQQEQNQENQEEQQEQESQENQQEQQDQQEQENQENQQNQDEQQDQQDGQGEDSQEQQEQEGEESQDQNDQQDQGKNESQDQQDPNQEQQDGQGQPQDGENHEGEGQPSQTPAPGQRMTEDQARQLLAAIAQDSETLQEKLGQIMFFRSLPPIQDW